MKKFVTSISSLLVSTFVFGQITITAAEAKDHINQIVSICDRVVDAKFLESSITRPTLLNIGGAYPNHLFTLVINFENRTNFPFKPEEFYLNKRVCVTGRLIDFKGRPQIVVLSPAEMILNEDETNTPPNTSSTSANRTTSAMPVANSPVQNTPATTSSATHTTPSSTPQAKQTDTLVTYKSSSTQIPKTTSTVVSKPATQPAAKVNTAPSQTVASAKHVSDTSALKVSASKSTDTYDVKLTSDVNMRAEPLPTSEVVDVVKSGTTVTILNSENGWSYLMYDKYSQEQRRTIVMKGYVKNSVLK